MAEGAAQGLTDLVVAQNDGIYDYEPRIPPFRIPTMSFPQWCEQVLRPAVLT